MFRVTLLLFFSFASLFAFEHLTSDNIEEKLKGKNTIVDFYATWCPPCKVLAKNLIEFDKVKPENISIYKVDIDKQRNLAKKYGIRTLPTIIFFKDGKVMKKEVGIKDTPQLTNSSRKYFN